MRAMTICMCDVICSYMCHDQLKSLVRMCAMTQQAKAREEVEKRMRDELHAACLEEQVFYMYV